jgi:hypothetical protein
MTGRALLHKLQDTLAEDETLAGMDATLDIPQWYRLKAAFERIFYDSYYDPKTPCPHQGTKWRLEDGVDRCGQCGRRIEREAAA